MMRAGGERLAVAAPARAVLTALPYAIPRRFDPAAADGLDATFELRVDGGRFAVRIAEGRCKVTPGPAPGADTVVSVSGSDLIRLGSGAVGWPELLSSRRLAVSGDPFLGLRFPMLFRLPASIPRDDHNA
jgi:hypothetical protein